MRSLRLTSLLTLLVHVSLLTHSPLAVAQQEAGQGKEQASEKKEESARSKRARAPSDAAIRKLLIKASIDDYDGNCPCPYNTARNGSRCGKRSAWSKPGGASPLCYDSDVTDEMVAEYRAEHDLEQE